jgi:hypothetical protein
MMSDVAEIEVVCPGMLDVLSVGKGDIRLTVSGTPEEIEKGRRIIEEMLAKGYSIFVEGETGLKRVKKFNPARMTYVISELAPPGSEQKVVEKEVPVAGSKAKAIGRTAGG